MTVSQHTARTAHLAWCALIALHLARKDGLIHSEPQENLFLIRWFAGAERQRRFPREVAADICWLLKQGRTLGINAHLRSKLEYLWQTCSGNILEQTDMFRLTWGLDTLKGYHWVHHILSDREWSSRNRVRISPEVNAVCLLRSSLERAFSEDGQQVHPVLVRISGQVSGLKALLATCGWTLLLIKDDEWYLMADAAPIG